LKIRNRKLLVALFELRLLVEEKPARRVGEEVLGVWIAAPGL